MKATQRDFAAVAVRAAAEAHFLLLRARRGRRPRRRGESPCPPGRTGRTRRAVGVRICAAIRCGWAMKRARLRCSAKRATSSSACRATRRTMPWRTCSAAMSAAAGAHRRQRGERQVADRQAARRAARCTCRHVPSARCLGHLGAVRQMANAAGLSHGRRHCRAHRARRRARRAAGEIGSGQACALSRRRAGKPAQGRWRGTGGDGRGNRGRWLHAAGQCRAGRRGGAPSMAELRRMRELGLNPVGLLLASSAAPRNSPRWRQSWRASATFSACSNRSGGAARVLEGQTRSCRATGRMAQAAARTARRQNFRSAPETAGQQPDGGIDAGAGAGRNHPRGGTFTLST